MRIRELILGISMALLITSVDASNVDAGAGDAGAWSLEVDGRVLLFMHPASLGGPMTSMTGASLEDDGWVNISGFIAPQYVPGEGEETTTFTPDELRERFPFDGDLVLRGDMWVMSDRAPEEGRPTQKLSVFAHALPPELGELGLTGSETAAVMWQALEGDEDGVFALVLAALRNSPRWTEEEREIVGDDYFKAPGVIEGCAARAQELTSEILSQLARGKTEELDALREARDRREADMARWGVFMEDTRRHLAAAAPDIEARVFDPLMEALRASAQEGTTDSAWVVPPEKWDDLVAAWLEFGNEGVLQEDDASADEGGE